MNLWLHRYATATAVATLFLIFAGGLVTSTGSGLAVPDWPLSYGMLMPPMVGGIFYEHGHRMVATAVGFLTFILTLWILKRETRVYVRNLGLVALSAVVLQGLLGGLTVRFLLPTPISVSHATLGQTFLCILTALAVVTSPWWKKTSTNKTSPETAKKFTQWSVFTVLTVYVQLILGAVMRHKGAGLAIPDFPLMFGHFFPPTFTFPIFIHFAHRSWALVVFGMITTLFIRSRRVPESMEMVRPFTFMLWLISMIQIGLGAWTVLSEKMVWATTFHVVTGAFTLAMSVLISLLSARMTDFSLTPLRSYFELTKPRITFMVLMTTAVGFHLGSPGHLNFSLMFWTLVSTGLVASGASALNQAMEPEIDAKMKRTRLRPLPMGKLSVTKATAFGLFISIIGFTLFLTCVNTKAFVLALGTHLAYLLIYTPLKKVTSWSTWVGAFPGAMPPAIGWVAASSSFDFGALLLFVIQFLWQMPHFYSIGWLYREDYENAKLPILPVVDPTGKRVSQQTLFYLVLLIAFAVGPYLLGICGKLYLCTALILSMCYFASGILLASNRTKIQARQVLLASVIYLPMLFISMTIDKI